MKREIIQDISMLIPETIEEVMMALDEVEKLPEGSRLLLNLEEISTLEPLCSELSDRIHRTVACCTNPNQICFGIIARGSVDLQLKCMNIYYPHRLVYLGLWSALLDAPFNIEHRPVH